MTQDIIEKNLQDICVDDLPQVNSLTINDDVFDFILNQWVSGKRHEIKTWLSLIKEKNYKFGTKEWADDNFNTHYACNHGCWYCYAWCEAYQRRRSYWENWGKKMERRKYSNKAWITRKNGYTIMYPTTHDIVPEIMHVSFQAIRNMLKANINVLVVSKPHIEVIESIIDEFSDYREGQPKITLRFSISTNNNELIDFWERGAPKYEERLKCLKIAFKNGFNTSVSMEPFFPAKKDKKLTRIENFISLVNQLLKNVRGTLWIGMMNHVPVNVQRGVNLNMQEKKMIQDLNKFYRFENIYKLMLTLHSNNKIKWKESIKKKMINHILGENRNNK